MNDTTDVAVVGIQDNASGATCTGALIAPNLVLTAQHCVAPLMGMPGCPGAFGPPRAASNFFVTTKATFTLSPNDYHRVSAVRLPPGTGVCGNDVALLVLTQVIAPSEADDLVPRIESSPQAGELYSAVGFGATDDMGTGSGQRRRRDNLAVACAGAVDAGCVGFATEWLGEAGVCGGDSGGPALDSSGRVIGVASRGAVNCTFPTYADLHAYAAWLISEGRAAAMSGGYVAPSWVTGPVVDAGVDAGVGVDAGLDAGTVAADAGTMAADAGTLDGPNPTGCGCSSLPMSSVALCALTLLCRRRGTAGALHALPNSEEAP